MKLRHVPKALGPTLRLVWMLGQPQRRMFYIHGLKRSGNHALINWIMRQSPGQGAFLNDILPGHALVRPADKVLYRNPKGAGFTDPTRHYPQGPSVFVSYEDRRLSDIYRHPREQRRRNRPGRTFELLILRDPFNLFASRFRRTYGYFYQDRDGYRSYIKELWKAYAREFLGETQFLPYAKVCVNYNRWVTQEAYRRELAHQLGLPFTDLGREDVPAYGGGSSFEGVAATGQAQQMQVLDRWPVFRDDPDFRSLFQGETELLELSRSIFGDLPGTEHLVQGA